MNPTTVSMEFFEAKYKREPDPWRFETNPYELDRYGEIVSTLCGERFRRAFEPGCSVGVLTKQLAGVCDRVFAIDISPTAVANARARCAGLSGVTIDEGSLPGDIPAGTFDLIVFSEIGYYFEAPCLRAMVDHLAHRLNRGGVLVAAHWLGCSEDHILHGDEVHTVIRESLGVDPELSRRYAGFRIDLWRQG